MNTNKHHPVIEPGTTVAGITLQAPMNAKRIRVLTRRRCGLFVDDDGRDELAGIESAFYCLSLTSDDLTSIFGWNQEEWDKAVDDFAMNLPDNAVEEFTALFGEESKMMREVSVEADDSEGDTGDAGKTERQETLGRSLAGSQASSPQPLRAVSDTPKQNQSLSSASCNTSTLSAMPTASGFVGRVADPRTATD